MIIPLYLDTSAAVKLFFRDENGSNALSAYLAQIQTRGDSYALRASTILRVEMDSVIRRKLSETGKANSDYSVEIRSWRDYESRRIHCMAVDDGIIAVARELLADARITGRLRSLDAIHLASCRILKERYRDTVFVVADQALVSAAKNIGLNVFDPENP